MNGKQFEDCFKNSCKMNCLCVERLYDTAAGRVGLANICDFVAYSYPVVGFIECKAVKGKSLPISNISQKQFSGLLEKCTFKGVLAGFLIYFYEQDLVYFITAKDLSIHLNKSNKASINITELDELCDKNISYEVPFTKKRVNIVMNVRRLFEWFQSKNLT